MAASRDLLTPPGGFAPAGGLPYRAPVNTRSRSRTPALAALGVTVCFTMACGFTHVRVPLMRPAEVNLAGYRTLAIAEFTGGPSAPLIAGRLEERLLEAGRFEVVDRTHMSAVMNELKLSASDLADSSGTERLGKLVTAGALITCAVDERYTETPRESRTRDKKGREHVQRWIEASYVLRANVRLTDVATGKLLVARSIEAKQGSGAATSAGAVAAGVLGALLSAAVQSQASGSTDTQATPPDRAALEREAREEVVTQFLNAISPRQEWVEVAFATDSDLPQLATGIAWAQRGDWPKALASFEAAISAAENNPSIDSKKLAKAYRDAGLGRVYMGDYAAGERFLQKGFDLSADPSLLDEIDKSRKLAADARRLSEQLKAPAAGR